MTARPPLYHLIDLWISLTRQLQEAADPKAQEHFGVHLGDLMIRCAVYIGTIEERPMTAAKLATYVGIPRPTVERRLRALADEGIVERVDGAWLTPQPRLEKRAEQDFSAMINAVRATHRTLKYPKG